MSGSKLSPSHSQMQSVSLWISRESILNCGNRVRIAAQLHQLACQIQPMLFVVGSKGCGLAKGVKRAIFLLQARGSNAKYGPGFSGFRCVRIAAADLKQNDRS